MRHHHLVHAFILGTTLVPSLLFWKKNDGDLKREEVFNDLYDVLASVYESAANLKPHWAESWDERHLMKLPPRFEQSETIPRRTLDAVREMRFARSLLQRHRWRSVRQPLFEGIEPTALATLQRRLQIASTELLSLEDERREHIRLDEIAWIDKAVEGFDSARAYQRTAERAGEPLDRQVANFAYLAIHQSLQLSDRLIERQRFELSKDE
jgi:hypothetical protein